MVFCNKHRLPENHKCPFDLRSRNYSFQSLENPLYQDALEYMNTDLTVARIYDYVTTKQMTKSEAIELLAYLFENSDNIELRKIAIMAFKVLELKNSSAFKALEDFLISEEDPSIRNLIAEIISLNFPKKSKELLDWIEKKNND
jgi:hypothetical protein